MTLSKLFFASVFLLTFTFTSYGQVNWNYKIDTFKVMTNQNLDNFLYKLQFDNFEIYKDKNNIPSFIRQSLDSMTGGDFSLANPHELFRCCCTSSPDLPKRKLLFLAKSKNMLVMSYWTGGMAEEMHLIMINFYEDLILDVWAGSAFEYLTSRKKIISFLKKARTKDFNRFGFL